MATAEELFRTADYAEPHIIINGDRTISVPNELKYLGVQYDHNIETVVFDCPRYWDGYDLSELDIYINYTDVGGVLGAHHCMDVSVSKTNENIINFSWTILQNLTLVPGKIAFLICAQKVNDDSTVEQCWHSRLCTECEILPGMECAHGGSEDEVIVPDNYDMGNFIMSYMPEEAITDALVSYFKTATGPVLYPITTFDAVRATDGETLTKVLSDINNNINNAQDTADNAIPRSGGEFTGNITVTGRVPKVETFNTASTISGNLETSTAGNVAIVRYVSDNEYTKLELNTNGNLNYAFCKDGQWSINKIYGEHNKPTPSAIGAMPIVGGTFTGDVDIEAGKSLDFKVKDGTKLRIIGGVSTNRATIRLVDANDATISEILQIDTTTGEITSASKLMPKSGGTFTGNVVAKQTQSSGDYIRNFAVKANGGDNVSTIAIYGVRK